CCDPSRGGAQPVAWTSLAGDAACNFADGVAIGASFMVSVPLGIAATLAILLHELPQEAGQCAVLLRSGMHPRRALRWNALTALPALAGTALALLLPLAGEEMGRFLLPAVAGAFLHIAIADLLPQVRRASGAIGLRHGAAFTAGIAIMAGLLLLD
ncbi:MAG TPA: ZIP family metal transporter, partial [Candidatus Thermoplasmatota archaeon]|nr:ZIP family metal transporter [Candidatus Thermoplasmatota archaeon]